MDGMDGWMDLIIKNLHYSLNIASVIKVPVLHNSIM